MARISDKQLTMLEIIQVLFRCLLTFVFLIKHPENILIRGQLIGGYYWLNIYFDVICYFRFISGQFLSTCEVVASERVAPPPYGTHLEDHRYYHVCGVVWCMAMCRPCQQRWNVPPGPLGDTCMRSCAHSRRWTWPYVNSKLTAHVRNEIFRATESVVCSWPWHRSSRSTFVPTSVSSASQLWSSIFFLICSLLYNVMQILHRIKQLPLIDSSLTLGIVIHMICQDTSSNCAEYVPI